MTQRDENEAFYLQISRELGSIDSKLEHISNYIDQQNKQISALWHKMDIHAEQISTLKTRVIVLCVVLSTVVPQLPRIFRLMF